MSGGGRAKLGPVPDGDLEVLVWALEDVAPDAMAQLAGGEDRRGRTHGIAVDDHRPAGTAGLQELDRGDDVVAGAEADVVEIARGVAVGPVSDHHHRISLLGQQLGPGQAVSPMPLVAMQHQHARGVVAAVDEPGTDLLSIASRDAVALQSLPAGAWRRFVEPGIMATRQPIGDRR